MSNEETEIFLGKALKDLIEYAEKMPGYSNHPLTEGARKFTASLEEETILATRLDEYDDAVCSEAICSLPNGHDGLHVPLQILWQEAGYIEGPWNR